MRRGRHPGDEQLFQLVDEPPLVRSDERDATEAHVQTCGRCSRRLGEIRHFVGLLRQADVWDNRSLNVERRLEWLQQASDAAARVRAEMDAAVKVINEVTTGPSSWWRKRLSQIEGTRTYGFVRGLLERAAKLSDRSPSEALEATAIAVEIAEELRVDAYPFDLVISVRAEAWREHAYSLLFVGRFPEAQGAVDRAEQLFGQLPVPGVELARAWVTRSFIYRMTDRVAEALALTRKAAGVFWRFGLNDRYVKTRMAEAAMLHQQGALADALEVWKSLEDQPILREDASFGMLLQNIGTTYSQLGELERAHDYLDRALEEYGRLGIEHEKIRTRWSLASALVTAGRLAEALPILRQTWREFDAAELRASGALVGLEIAEVLLVMGQPEEVPAICRTILDEFTRSGMTSRAINALSFLREAVALGNVTPSLVRHVHDFIRDIPGNPPRTFTPPPA